MHVCMYVYTHVLIVACIKPDNYLSYIQEKYKNKALMRLLHICLSLYAWFAFCSVYICNNNFSWKEKNKKTL